MPQSPAIRAAAIVSVILVAAIGWYLGSPLFIRTTANEALPTAAPTGTAATSAAATPIGTATVGTATPATPSGPMVLLRGDLQYVDNLHNGKGPVSIIRVGEQRFVRFENVEITNAPDVHVYLSRETGGKWSESTSLYLGALKATNGSFNYDIPAGTDVAPYKSVVVWCRAFAVLITWADLRAA